MNSIIEEEEFSNDISFSQNVLSTSKIDNNITLNFVKNIIFNNDIEEDTDSVKKFQIKEKDDCLFNILNMRNNISFNSDSEKLHIDDKKNRKNILYYQHLIYLLLRIQYRYCYMILLNYLNSFQNLV